MSSSCVLLQDECSFVSLRDVERVLEVMTWFFQQNQGQDPTYLFDMMDDDDDDESDDDGEEDMENEAPQYVGLMKCQVVPQYYWMASYQNLIINSI